MNKSVTIRNQKNKCLPPHRMPVPILELREIMKKVDLEIKDVAQIIGVSRQTVSLWRNNHVELYASTWYGSDWRSGHRKVLMKWLDDNGLSLSADCSKCKHWLSTKKNDCVGSCLKIDEPNLIQAPWICGSFESKKND
jgi:DNA-binding XRE family transcriptional regulator